MWGWQMKLAWGRLQWNLSLVKSSLQNLQVVYRLCMHADIDWYYNKCMLSWLLVPTFWSPRLHSLVTRLTDNWLGHIPFPRLSTWEWETLSPPIRTMGGVRSGRGQPSREILAPARDFFKSARKQLPAPPENEKNIALAFLKGAWLQIPYGVHFTFKGLKSNIYVHYHLVIKSLNGISFQKWNHQPRM